VRRRLEGLVALVVVQVCFGVFPVLVKLAQDGGNGFTTRSLASWRITVGALVLGAFAVLRHGRACLPRRSDLGRLFVCALLGIVANQLLALEGAARASAAKTGILFTLIPVFTYTVAAAVKQETLTRRRSAGIAVALVGAVLLILGRGGNPGYAPDPIGGSLMLVANCFAYAVYLVLARRLLDHLPTLVVIAWVFVLSLWVPPLLVATGDASTMWPETVSGDAWIGFGGLLVFTTVLAYLLNTYALARVSASTTAVFIYLQPLISVGAAVLMLGERPGSSAAVATALLFAGIWLVVRRGHSECGGRATPQVGRIG
jgi:drug/metabolite transporter (DMT)-like permease